MNDYTGYAGKPKRELKLRIWDKKEKQWMVGELALPRHAELGVCYAGMDVFFQLLCAEGHAQLWEEAQAAGFDTLPAYMQHLDQERIKANVPPEKKEQEVRG